MRTCCTTMHALANQTMNVRSSSCHKKRNAIHVAAAAVHKRFNTTNTRGHKDTRSSMARNVTGAQTAADRRNSAYAAISCDKSTRASSSNTAYQVKYKKDMAVNVPVKTQMPRKRSGVLPHNLDRRSFCRHAHPYDNRTAMPPTTKTNNINHVFSMTCDNEGYIYIYIYAQ